MTVEAVCDSGTIETVYNCRVAEYHTYFVGSADWQWSVWAHNACNGTKPGPETNPNAPHNATIREVAEKLIAKGYKIIAGGGRLPEKLIETKGGYKNGRRPDILYLTQSGNRRGINVGRTTAKGDPVPREVKALEDLNGPGGVPTIFVPYHL